MTPERTTAPSIERAELVRIVNEAIPRNYRRDWKDALRAVARTNLEFAVGTWKHSRCLCPAAAAGLWPNARTFATVFDGMMLGPLGMEYDELPVVVTVTDPEEADD